MVFWFEMEKRISKNIFIFHIWLLNWKKKNEKKLFWFKIYFDLKSISKNKNQNFGIHFLTLNQKMNFKKFFQFSILVMNLKNEKRRKIFKIRFVFKSKNELYFRYTDLTWNLNLNFHLFWKLKNNLVLYFMP